MAEKSDLTVTRISDLNMFDLNGRLDLENASLESRNQTMEHQFSALACVIMFYFANSH